jgi:purine nucleosidase
LLTAEDVQTLGENDSPVSRFIADATRFYMDFHSDYQQIRGCVINDPLALALAFQPDLVESRSLFVDVDLSGGVSMGNTFADFYHMEGKEANMEVALDVHPRRFIELFLERMQKLSQSRR